MPSRWIVPNCRTGRKGRKIKRSVFLVPKDKELLEKWEAAIPGKKQLRASHVVCENHFESQYIHREWIKYGTDGQIIAKSPYELVRLSKLAIPTKFDNDDYDDNKENKNVDFGNRAVNEMQVNDSNPINVVDLPPICHVASMEESLCATIIANNGSPVADVEVSSPVKIEDGGAASRIDGKPFPVPPTVTFGEWI